jgi:hypothetical protein
MKRVDPTGSQLVNIPVGFTHLDLSDDEAAALTKHSAASDRVVPPSRDLAVFAPDPRLTAQRTSLIPSITSPRGSGRTSTVAIGLARGPQTWGM